jgi:hypothetical protein
MAAFGTLLEAFGIELKRKPPESLETFTLSREDVADGLASAETAAGGIAAISYEASNVPADEREQINSYRSMAMSADIDEALQEIRNEIFIFDIPGERAFELAFTEEDGAPEESIQEEIIEEFRELYEISNFREHGMQYFDDWYVDSKIYFHKVIDKDNTKLGIQKLIQVDPLKIRKVRLIPRQDPLTGTIDVSKIKELYVYGNQFPTTYQAGYNGIMEITFGTHIEGLQIEPDSITYVDSGFFDRSVGRYIGYLKKAILPFNNLRMMEDAMLIFRVVRAPMRRAFYIDVSSMQKNKAEEYMKSMMSRFKNKMVYDSRTGALSDRRNIQSMMEDYWLPRRDSGKGTEIQNLEGQDSTSVLEEVNYYRQRLYRALNVPYSRFSEQPSSFAFGKGIEIQRDEYRFKKYQDRLRQNFMRMWDDLLKTQLILKKIIVEEEWDDIRRFIFWNYSEDNAFVEFKESELINNRVQILSEVDPFVGKYFSKEWVRRKILKQDDDEFELEDEAMKGEKKDTLKSEADSLRNTKRVEAEFEPDELSN